MISQNIKTSLPCVAIQSILLFWAFNGLTALYEDQIGKFDWRKQWLGRTEHVHLSPLTRRICVSTAANVVAALSTNSGAIVWRQLYESNEKGKIDALSGWQDELFVVSNGGRLVRVWSIATGFLLREISLVQQRSDDKIVSRFYHLMPERQELSAASVTSDASLLLMRVNCTSNSAVVISSRRLAVPWKSSSVRCEFISEDYIACIDSANHVVHSVRLEDNNEAKFFSADLSPFLISETNFEPKIIKISMTIRSEDDVIDDADDRWFALRVHSGRSLFLRDHKGVLSVASDLQETLNVAVTDFKGEPTTFVLKRQNDTLRLELSTGFNISTIRNSVEIDLAKHHGMPEQMWIFENSRKEAEPTFRVLLVNEDDSLTLHQMNGKTMWSREEALASVITVEMIDLPMSESDVQFEQEFRLDDANLLSMLLKRLTSQLFQLESAITALLSGFKSRNAFVDTQNAVSVTRDVFNLNKMIVLVTASRKVFGIDSSSGTIVWQRFLPHLQPFNTLNRNHLFLFTQTKTAHFPQSPQCAVIGKDARNGRGLMYLFNPITGEAVGLGFVRMDFRIAQATLLPYTDDNYVRGILFLDTDGQVHIHPGSAVPVARKMTSSLFIYAANTKDSVITGYGFNLDKKKGGLAAYPVWNINLPSAHAITNIVVKQANEHVHSQGRVMGDRSVMYKYLNPNIIAVIVESTDVQQKPFFKIILIDVVTGYIVFSGVHKRCRAPVSVVLSENWVVYAYYSEKGRRTEMSVLELYEGKVQSNTTAFSSLHPPLMPMVERQAYLFPPGLDAMSTTITEKGITSKHLLFALPSGGIVELPKSLLDPRRSVIQTQEHREESIYPYIPELPVPTENIINYNQSIFRVTQISTAPAGLESTCLVLAFGLDLFFARVTPSRTFDLLKDDFDHFLITVVLVALILSAYVIRQLAARKALHQAWK